MSHGGTVVVVGAGVAGLAAAAAAAPWTDQVVVLERDDLPADPRARRGVPQSGQLHNVLSRGLRHLEDLLPGFRAAVLAAGGTESAVGSQTHIYDVGCRLPTRDIGLTILSAWRPTIELAARQLLDRFDNVELRGEVRVDGVEIDAGGAVVGVTATGPTGTVRLAADLVVDATGVQALGARALPDPVEEERVTFNRWYASTAFSRVRGEGFWMVFPTAPETRSGLVSPAGPDEWHVSVSGGEHDRPPDGGEEVLAHVAALEDPQIAELLAGCEAIGPTHLFRRPTAVRKRYDLLADPRDGFVAVGDAALSLNPLLGLGISAAAGQAAVLGEVLRHRGALPLRSVPGQYFASAATVTNQAWELSLLTNHPLVEAVLPSTAADVGRVRAAVTDLIWDDIEVQRRDSEVWHLVRHHRDLTTPDLVARVLRSIDAPPSERRRPETGR